MSYTDLHLSESIEIIKKIEECERLAVEKFNKTE